MNDLITAATSGLFVEVGKIIGHMKAQQERIAELERQLAEYKQAMFDAGRIAAEASTPAVEQDKVICANLGELLLTLAQRKAADTDKVREAISDEQIMRIAGDVKQRNAGAWPGDVAFARAVLASMAAQAPVREVPGWKLVPLEVTDAMLEAWKTELCVPIGSSPEAKARRAYRAMLAVAPMHKEKNNE